MNADPSGVAMLKTLIAMVAGRGSLCGGQHIRDVETPEPAMVREMLESIAEDLKPGLQEIFVRGGQDPPDIPPHQPVALDACR